MLKRILTRLIAPTEPPPAPPARSMTEPRPGERSWGGFYCFYGEDASVPASTPVPVSDADAYELFARLEADGDFFGLIDTDDETFQVAYDADSDRYWTEIPDVERRGSHGANFTFDEMVEMMKTLPDRFRPSAFPKLRFSPWEDPG